MAAEFYRKTAALYEEFKRRELNYLNVEKSVNSSFFTKSDTNSPYQDYLESLNKREKESEKSHRALLKHLDDMDRNMDQMSLKLEKLHALRNVAIASSNTSWPAMSYTFDRPSMSQYDHSFQEKATTSFSQLLDNKMIHMNPSSEYNLPNVHTSSESTQTEHLFCENCHYPLTRNLMSSVSSTATEPIIPNKIGVEEHRTRNSLTMSSNQNIYDEIGQMMKSSIHNTSSGQIIQNEGISKEYMDTHPFESNQNIHKAVNPKEIFNTEILQTQGLTSTPFKETDFHKGRESESHSKQNSNFIHSKAPLTGNLIAEPNNSTEKINSNLKNASLTDDISLETKTSSEAKQIITQQDNVMDSSVMKNSVFDTTMKNSVANNMESGTTENNTENKGEMFEKAASKSDDESINHEFDFLESDRRPSMKNKNIEPENKVSVSSKIHLSENSLAGNIHENTSLEETSVRSHDSVPELKNTAISKNPKSSESFLTTDDAKMESSLSEGLPSPVQNSADDSDHSDSDSLSEKGTPFTASAAYQALLGNVSATKSKQKVSSHTDTESEDEIENAYAMVAATRKSSNINFDAIIQVQKKEERKNSTAEVIQKKERKVSIPVSGGSSQIKLAKNTRKALGLETSSGSEMELETKPTVDKIDEDSDEFDFYN